MKKCSCCQKEKEETEFHKDVTGTKGLNGRCKPCNVDYSNKRFRTTKGRYSTLKRVARAKHLDLQINLQQFEGIIQNPCYYCGSELDETSTTYFLDRLDNTEGYTENNSVACCGTCNFMKREMTKDQLVEQCQKILRKLIGT